MEAASHAHLLISEQIDFELGMSQTLHIFQVCLPNICLEQTGGLSCNQDGASRQVARAKQSRWAEQAPRSRNCLSYPPRAEGKTALAIKGDKGGESKQEGEEAAASVAMGTSEPVRGLRKANSVCH